MVEIARKDVGNYHAHIWFVNGTYTVYTAYNTVNGFARRVRKFTQQLDAADFFERWLTQDESKSHLGFITE